MAQARTANRKPLKSAAATQNASETLRSPLSEIVGADTAEEFMKIAKQRTHKAEQKARDFMDVAFDRVASLGQILVTHRVIAAVGGVGLGLLLALGLRRRSR